MESHEPRNLPLDVVSLKFNPYGDKLFFGCHEGDGIIYDIFTNSTTYETRLFETTVLSIDWKSNQILTGCSDGSSSIIDMRDEKPIINIQSSHLEEVCSVKFQPDSYLYATCGNDCTVKIWDQRNLDKEPLVTYSEHEAAIRAVSWCPTNKDLIVTGGGTADRCIKMWNVQTGDTIKSINTGSQVCNLFWNSEYDEIFSTHGYSQNHLAIWKGTDLSPVASFHNHRQRILYMCHSPDGTTVATAAPDDSLQIWKMFPSKRASISQSLLLLR
ncbi:WD repeat protein [Histomonas meleagridis]|uniref:WD repeat protein n=1 Tax=Histomonas meleagridis TaxID=135588 RepID=UPI00355A807D|nr:WD repeat protein [Histomonas meleagridis]KAH0803220.1 WD repeat protein [Histomonas meleagridis]